MAVYLYRRLRPSTAVIIAFMLMLLPLCARGQELVFQRITTADGLSNNQVQHIGQLEDGRMLFVSWRGINIYDGARITTYPRQDELTVALPHCTSGYTVATSCDGLVWVKEYGRLWCLDVKRGEMRGDIPALLKSGEKGLLDVYFVDGSPWLLTADGLRDNLTGKTFTLPCPADSVMELKVADGMLLLFCLDGGVKVMRDDWLMVGCPDVPPLRHIYDVRVSRGPDGMYYRKLYGDRYSRIDRFDPRRLVWQAVMEQPMVLYGMSWVNGELIVGCRHGYFNCGDCHEVDNQERSVKGGELQPSFRTESGDELHDISVQQMFADSRGGLWVALTDCGVLYTHPQRHRFHSAKHPQTLNVPDSVVWLCHRRLSELFHFTEQRDHDNLTDRSGRCWRATHNGIFIDSLHITTADGLPSDFVQSLVEDKSGRVWVGTNRGVCCIENTAPLQIVNYGVHDGVPQWDAMASSAAMLSDGHIAMQFEQGWVTFHPDSVQRPACTLTPILTSAPATTLKYFENNVTLAFATDYYAFPQSVCYQWRVNGDNWQRGDVGEVRDGQLRLSFMHLHPGDYTVQVKAAIDNGAFDGTVCTFCFTVLPPWWQTWWAYTLYILCVLAITGVIMWQYIRRKQERLKQRMREESLLKQIETLMQAAQESVEQPQPQAVETEVADVEPKEEELSPEDSEFVRRAIELVNEHLCDSYTVEQMAADLCMERTGLYKRLTALVNQSPQLFIRSIRLNRAVEMMKRGDTITDAAYAAGFNSVSYFGRCFAKEFGCSPSEYMKQS